MVLFMRYGLRPPHFYSSLGANYGCRRKHLGTCSLAPSRGELSVPLGGKGLSWAFGCESLGKV